MKKIRMFFILSFITLCFLTFLCMACVSTESSTVTLKVNTKEKNIYNESTKFALIVGVSQFADDWITDLDYAANDAEDLYQTLTVYNQYPGENITILTNANAGKAAILDGLRDLAQKARKKNDVLLFLYSGHGVSLNGESCILPADTRLDRRGNLIQNSLVSLTELQDAVKGSRCQTVFFLDACRTNVISGEKGTAGIGKVQGLNGADFGLKEIILISASRSGMPSYESSTYRASYMSYALNNGLRGKADTDRSGFISLVELVRYMDNNVKKLSLEEGREREQEISVRNVEADMNVFLGVSMFGWEQGKKTELDLKATKDEEFTILSVGSSAFDKKKLDTFNKCYAVFKRAEGALDGKRYKQARELYDEVQKSVTITPYKMGGDENFVLLYNIAKSKFDAIGKYFQKLDKQEQIKTDMRRISGLYEQAVNTYGKAKTLKEYQAARDRILDAIAVINTSPYKSEEEYVRSLAQLKEWLEEIDKWIISIASYEKNKIILANVLSLNINLDRPWYQAQREKHNVSTIINAAVTFKKKICIINNKSYGNMRVELNAAIQLHDGNYIFCGGKGYILRNYNEWDPKLYVVKTDKWGDILWQKSFDEDKNSYGNSIIETDDGDYLICGTKWNIKMTYTTDTHEPFRWETVNIYLIKLDKMGNKIWDKIIGNLKYDTGYGCLILKTSDGCYLICGKSLTEDNYGAFIFKLNKNGKIIWQKYFDKSKSLNSYFESGIINDENEYLFCGSTNGWGTWSGDRNNNIYFVKTDKDGNKIWEKEFGGTVVNNASALFKTSDDNYLICGRTYPSQKKYVISLIKTDNSGNYIWEKTFEDGQLGFAVNQMDNGNYVICCEGKNGIYMIITDKDGNRLGEKIFGGINENSGSSKMTKTSDGGFIICGMEKCGNNDLPTAIFLIKTDKNGNIAELGS